MLKTKAIKVGDTFEYQHPINPKYKYVARREADDRKPPFECETMRVTILGVSSKDRAGNPVFTAAIPYTFGAEPQWFKERGLIFL